jgi:multiple sugar transport system permease protein
MPNQNTDAIPIHSTKHWSTSRKREAVSAYLFIAPFMILLFIFAILPIFITLKQSLETGGTVGPRTFVGLQNYITVLKDPKYYTYLLNNFIYIVMSIPIGQFIAFGLALYLKKTTKLSPIFETIYFMPLLISMAAAGVMMSYLFSPNGAINYFLELLGISAPNWLNQPFTAKVVIVVLEVWKGCTFYIYIYVAALRGIPNDYYEVGLIEGATSWQMLRKVTLPLMRNSILLCVVMSTIWQLQLFDSIFVTTGGGPLNSSRTIVYEIYELTFKKQMTGLGAALSMLFLVVILIITALQLRLNKGDIEY